MIIGSTTVNLGSDALNQAFYNEVYDSNGNPRSPLLLNLLQSFTGTITAAEYIVALHLRDTSTFFQ